MYEHFLKAGWTEERGPKFEELGSIDFKKECTA
jgi:hypothetical protein